MHNLQRKQVNLNSKVISLKTCLYLKLSLWYSPEHIGHFLSLTIFSIQLFDAFLYAITLFNAFYHIHW